MIDIRNIFALFGERGIILNRFRQRLSYTLIISAIAACLISALLFVSLQHISRKAIHAYCKKPEVVSSHIDKKIDSLQQYISDNHISLSAVSEIKHWMQGNDLTEIVIYENNILIYNSNNLSPSFSFPAQPTFPDFYLWHNKYVLNFPDGKADIFIKDFFEHRYLDYITYFNLFMFFFCFVTIMVIIIRRKVNYIGILEKEIRILEGGNLNYSITVKGHDELSSLAQQIDEMRTAFINRENYADRVKKASNRLMAGISHDLRTPLTSLIGYLEVLEGNNLSEKDKSFVVKCKNRALQIKNLSNDLFEYFVISVSDYENVELKKQSSQEVLCGIIEEMICLMEQNGFVVLNHIKLPTAMLYVNSDMIQRVFDNLLSNIQKYADYEHPIELYSEVNENELQIILKNHVRDFTEKDIKTELGLDNCKRIMLLNNGQLFYEQVDDIFSVKLIFL